MKTSQEYFKATFSNGTTDTCSANSLYQAKRYFLQFCKNDDGESNGLAITNTEQITNFNKSL